jgi:hypothetical protein
MAGMIRKQRLFSCRRRYFFPESGFTDDVHDKKTGSKKNRIQNKELKIRIAEIFGIGS